MTGSIVAPDLIHDSHVDTTSSGRDCSEQPDRTRAHD
jgi:hypothetical protein